MSSAISHILWFLPDRWFGVHAEDSDRFVVSANESGLCNRLKSLLSAMRVAERLSRSVAIYCPETKLVNCRFSDLFDNSFFEIPSAQGRWKIRGNEGKYCVVDTWRLLTFPGELPVDFSREYPSIRGDSTRFCASRCAHCPSGGHGRCGFRFRSGGWRTPPGFSGKRSSIRENCDRAGTADPAAHESLSAMRDASNPRLQPPR